MSASFSLDSEDLTQLLQLHASNNPGIKVKEFLKELLDNRDEFDNPGDHDNKYTLTPQNINKIAASFSIPPLVLYSLISEPETKSSLLCDTSTFHDIPTDFGHNCTYKIPPSRLAKAEYVIVHLNIDSGGYSDLHCHWGNELILVLEGTVELCFPENGQIASLGPMDYAHFNAWRLHIIANVGEKAAKLFIIRFYQWHQDNERLYYYRTIQKLLSQGLQELNPQYRKSVLKVIQNLVEQFADTEPRQSTNKLVRAIQDHLTPKRNSHSAGDGFKKEAIETIESVLKHALDEINDTLLRIGTPRPPDYFQEPGKVSDTLLSATVVDLYGLSKFLHVIARTAPKRIAETIKNTLEKMKPVRSNREIDGHAAAADEAARNDKVSAIDSFIEKYGTPKWIRKLMFGFMCATRPIQNRELPYLASGFNVPPFLFFDFTVPAVSDCVVIRSSRHPVTDKLKDVLPPDWIELPDCFCESDKPDRTYNIPIRRLAGSHVSISILELHPAFLKDKQEEDRLHRLHGNHHDGWEIILLLDGLVKVRVGDHNEMSLERKLGAFAQYESGKKHSVINLGESNAKVLVIRFYDSKKESSMFSNKGSKRRKAKRQ